MENETPPRKREADFICEGGPVMEKKKQDVQRDPDLLGRLINDTVLAGRLLFDSRVSRELKLIPLVVC